MFLEYLAQSTSINLYVNDDKVTSIILKYLGTTAIATLGEDGQLEFDFPESVSDLIVYDGEYWGAVKGAFVDEAHLYLIVKFAGEDFVYSPTSYKKWITFINCAEYESGEYYVNYLDESCIAQILPLE